MDALLHEVRTPFHDAVLLPLAGFASHVATRISSFEVAACSHSVVLRHCLLIVFTGGPRSALSSAVACGILLSVFEGVGVLVSRVFNEGTRPQLPPSELSAPLDVRRSSLTLCPSSTGLHASSTGIMTFWTLDVHTAFLSTRLSV